MVDFFAEGYTKTSAGVKTPVEVMVSGITDSVGLMPAALTKTTVYDEPTLDRTLNFTFDALPVAMIDSGANGGQGSVLLYTFPAGLVRVFGIRAFLTLTAGAGITATAAIVFSVGTTAVATDNATLESTEVTFLPSTAATLSGSAGTFQASNTAIVAYQDGRTTPVPVYLNFNVDTTGISANATLTVTGYVRMTAIVI